jgi:hypothetical protein
MTLPGIDPATFRFVAQCLNCATACPTILNKFVSSNDGIRTTLEDNGRVLEGSGHGEIGDPIVMFVWRV